MKPYSLARKTRHSRGIRRGSARPAPKDAFRELHLRPYQQAAFNDRSHGLEVWLWGRQTGKSFTLAAWAIDRLVTRPGRLVTILSNSLANGAELNQKCAAVARLFARAFEQADLSSAPQFESMNLETRVTIAGQVGRIKILPANPRTARGFSGDLILDEFAFHENSAAIWEAAEPILSANRDYLCRIASTPNGRNNMFYRLVSDPFVVVRRIPRSEAWRQGLQIFHPNTRAPITPDQARALAHDKRAYDQNYECIFESENMTLLTLDLISAAEDPTVGLVCNDTWSPAALSLLQVAAPTFPPSSQTSSETSSIPSPLPQSGGARPPGPPSPSEIANQKSQIANPHNFWVGVDVGRTQDLTVITVLEKQGPMFLVRAILRLRNLRLPQQQELLEVVCRSPRFCGAQVDMTGLGLGLYEYTRQKFGDRIRGLNFASNLPLSPSLSTHNSSLTKARAPEVLALRLLRLYEEKRIRHPIDPILREDLRKPERVTTSEGRVSIVATRTESGHADHFWSLALAVDAAQRQPETYIHVVTGLRPSAIPRNYLI